MKTLLFLIFFLPMVAQPSDLPRFSLSSENQYFYLNPKNSAAFFTKLEIKIIGTKDIFEAHQLKYEFSTNSIFMSQQDQKQVVVNPSRVGFFGALGVVDYQLGFWQHTPEGTDLNNPFDVIHGKDFRQPFSSENLGSAGLLTSAHLGNFNWQIFYIPQNRKSILPDTQSPWWPRTDALPVTNSSGTFLLPDSVSYKYRDEYEIDHPFQNNFGSTLKFTSELIDLSLFYYSGANQIPQISPHFNIDVISITPFIGVVRPPIELDLTWFRSEHVGLGASKVLGSFIWKSFCKNQKDKKATVSEINVCVFSLENSIDFSKATLRYFFQVNRQWKKKSTASQLETLLGFFEKSFSLGYLVDLNTENTVSGAFVYNEKSPSLLTSVRFEKRWSDKFKTMLSLNVITAQNEPLAKAYDQTDNFGLKFSYDF